MRGSRSSLMAFSWLKALSGTSRAGTFCFRICRLMRSINGILPQVCICTLKPSGYSGTEPFGGENPGSNGLAFDAAGRLVICEHGDRRITRLEADGSRTVLVDRFEGRRLNSPNDLAFDSRGDLYFTDPPYGLPAMFDDPAKELSFSGVYRLGRDGELTLLTQELTGPTELRSRRPESRSISAIRRAKSRGG